MNEYIEINGQRVYEGAIVTLSGYPDTRWLLCNGWFAYQGNYYMGWYFKSIPQGTVIAATPDVIATATVVDGVPEVPDPASDQPYITIASTSTIVMRFPEGTVDFTLADTMVFALRQGDVVLRKDSPDPSIEITANTVTVTLTQEETLMFEPGVGKVQLNWLYGDGKRGNSNEVGIYIYPNILPEVLP